MWIKGGSAELRWCDAEGGANIVALPVCWVSAGRTALTARTYGRHLSRAGRAGPAVTEPVACGEGAAPGPNTCLA